MGSFELSHIYPVRGNDRLGLLHPSNLVICPKEFNRKHSKSLPVEGYMGLSLPLSDVEEKWSIKDGMTAHEVLKLCRKFLGIEFDNWLKSHQISMSQQRQLMKKLEAEGLPRKQLLGLRLEELKALADEEEVPYFSMDKEPAGDWFVVQQEYLRLLPNRSLSSILGFVEEIEYEFLTTPSVEFAGTAGDYESFKNWVILTALLQLHGQPSEYTWKGQSLESYFKPKESWIKAYSHFRTHDDDYDDLL